MHPFHKYKDKMTIFAYNTHKKSHPTNKLFKIALIVLILLQVSCSNEETDIKLLFSESELETQNMLIHHLDSIVIHHSGTNDIENAYKLYFNKNRETINREGDIKLTGIYIEPVNSFLRTLNQDHLREFYTIRDTIQVYDETDSIITIPNVYQKDLRYRGKFIKLLDILQKDNKAISHYNNSLQTAGGLSPSHYPQILKYHHTFNVNNKYHRLIFVITFYQINRYYGRQKFTQFE